MIRNQRELLTNLSRNNPDAVIIGSIGTISYNLSDIPHSNKLLIRGAMGAALGAGFGYALGNPNKEVIVIIGDGSFLMQMGSMSTILQYALPNLRIIVLNNECYKSCGGQKTNFDSIKHLIPFEVYSVA